VAVDFRTATGGELLTTSLDSDSLRLSVAGNGSIVIETTVSNVPWERSIGFPEGGNWTRLTVRLNSEGHLVAMVDLEEPEISPTAVDVAAWRNLLRKGSLTVSGGFKGCLGAVRVSGILAPFFTSSEVKCLSVTYRSLLITSFI